MELGILSNKKSIKKTIANTILFAVAIFISITFFFIYYTVKININLNTNRNLNNEILVIEKNITKIKNHLILISEDEWNEAEHNIGNLYPIYVALYNTNKQLIRKSENLQNHNLPLSYKNSIIEDVFIDKIPVRKKQTKLYYESKFVGYAVVGISTTTQYHVLKNLKFTLIGTYFLVLILLYFLTLKVAGKIVASTLTISKQTKFIAENNFNGRLDIPKTKNELYDLVLSINSLLNKVEKTLTKQKQFTADASHQLKTPLAVLKGNLEVLIRRPRSQDEYIEKINFCLNEIDNASHIIDQLLFLARIENKELEYSYEEVSLHDIILESLKHYQSFIIDKKIDIKFNFENDDLVYTIPFALKIITDNLISNAIKYSNPNGTILISINKTLDSTNLSIQDFGVGIPKHELKFIFDTFYRSENIAHTAIQGNGLGLSIVKKLVDILKIDLKIDSKQNISTTVALSFIKNKRS